MRRREPAYHFHFGDIVVNEWAGKKNPHKVGVFINAVNNCYRILNRDGGINQYAIGTDRLVPTGERIDFSILSQFGEWADKHPAWKEEEVTG